MQIIRLLILLSFFVIMIDSCNNENNKYETFDVNEMLDYCAGKTKATMNNLEIDDLYPRNIEKNKKNWETKEIRNWTSGFWPGLLWFAYEFNKDDSFKVQAERFTAPIKLIANTSAKNHDIGFMIYCSFGNGYRLTGSEEYKKILLSAADTLATLFNPNVGSILSWPKKVNVFKHNTIVDNMMNLELLYWASKNGGSKKLFNIAQSHAEVTIKNLVREDGSLFHVGSFDPETGEFLKGITHQGHSDSSMWARGQAWGIYGVTISARETGRKDFLETSIKITNHFLSRLPKDGIPYWDFDDPNIPKSPKDASAAAIAACGILELVNLIDGKDQKEHYINSAVKIIKILSSDKYLSKDVNQAFLLHSTGHHPKDSEIDVPIIYADYYYFEALLKLKNINERI